jgi:hypothetical protein
MNRDESFNGRRVEAHHLAQEPGERFLDKVTTEIKRATQGSLRLFKQAVVVSSTYGTDQKHESCALVSLVFAVSESLEDIRPTGPIGEYLVSSKHVLTEGVYLSPGIEASDPELQMSRVHMCSKFRSHL